MNAATKYVVTCRPGSLRLHRRCSNQTVLSLIVDGFDSLQHFPSFFHLFPGPSYFGSSFAGTILFYTEVLRECLNVINRIFKGVETVAEPGNVLEAIVPFLNHEVTVAQPLFDAVVHGGLLSSARATPTHHIQRDFPCSSNCGR